MPTTDDHRTDDSTPSGVRRSALTPGRLARQGSIGSVLVVGILIAIAFMTTSIREPLASNPPAGAVGIAPSGGPTEPPGSWIVVPPSAGSSEGGEASLEPSPSASVGVLPTAWITSPPSGCHPYIKACDPSIQPVYPYVSVIITTDGSTTAELGVGKVTISAAGHLFTCSTFSKNGSCYYEVPAGTQVTATAYRQAGSMCTYFELMWEDYLSTVMHHDCSPITFTTKSQKAQLVANFDLIPPATPTPPTDPPATPDPTSVDPSTPEPTTLDTPTPS